MPRAAVLTSKQTRFLHEYLKDLNGAAAAVRAGYSQKSARATASALLALPHVKAELSTLERQQLDRAGVTAAGVLEQLRRIAFFDIARIYEERNELELIDCKCELCQRWELKESLGKGSKSHGPRPHEPKALTVTVKRMKHPADWPPECRVALANYETVVRNLTAGDGKVDVVLKVKLEPKLQALEMLAKHLGLLVERQEVESHLTISWLPPEPLPGPVIDVTPNALGAPSRSNDDDLVPADPQDRMVTAGGAPGPPDRPLPSRVSDRGPDRMAELGPSGDDMAEVGESGLSLRAQRKMFPELREGSMRRRR